MNKIECQNKIHEMINDSIHEGIYKETEDKTLDDLNNFKNFLYRSVKKYEYYEKMLPKLNQPGQLYETAKTHKLKKNWRYNVGKPELSSSHCWIRHMLIMLPK